MRFLDKALTARNPLAVSVFNTFSESGEIPVPPHETFWVTDDTGIQMVTEDGSENYIFVV